MYILEKWLPDSATAPAQLHGCPWPLRVRSKNPDQPPFLAQVLGEGARGALPPSPSCLHLSAQRGQMLPPLWRCRTRVRVLRKPVCVHTQFPLEPGTCLRHLGEVGTVTKATVGGSSPKTAEVVLFVTFVTKDLEPKYLSG